MEGESVGQKMVDSGEPSRASRAEVGKNGEDVALKFLQEQGMRLVARNWRCGHKEIDLIMDDGVCIRIVEVKSLCYPNSTAPVEMVDWHKRRRLIAAAGKYVSRYMVEKELVFDIVSVLFNGEVYKIEYIPAAFAPNW